MIHGLLPWLDCLGYIAYIKITSYCQRYLRKYRSAMFWSNWIPVISFDLVSLSLLITVSVSAPMGRELIITSIIEEETKHRHPQYPVLLSQSSLVTETRTLT